MRSLPSWVRLVFGVGVFFLVGTFFPQATRAASSPIMIGEVQWSGSSLSTADEWIELWNTSGETQSLNGFRLQGASSEPIIFTSAQIIPPYGTFLISNYSSTDTKTTLTIAPQVITTAVSLSNSSLHLELFNPAQERIDEAGTGGAPPAGSTSPVHASMIRDFPSVDVWITAESSLNLRDTSMDRGTPGICDGCAPPEPEDPISLAPVVSDEPVPNNPSPVVVLPEPVLSTTSTEGADIETHEETVIQDSTGGRSATSTTSSTNLSDLSPIWSSTSTSTTIEYPASTTTIPTAIEATTSSQATTTNTTTISSTNIETAVSSPHTSSPIVVDPVSSVVTPVSLVELRLQLNEVFPAPASGQTEWIELKTNRPFTNTELFGWSIENDHKSIFRFSTSTLEQAEICGEYIHIPFKSSKLKNAGDEVHIKNAVGSLIEIYRYGKTTKGSSWAREPDETGPWNQTKFMTPCIKNAEQTNSSSLSTSTPPIPDPINELPETDSDVVTTTQSNASIVATSQPLFFSSSENATTSTPSTNTKSKTIKKETKSATKAIVSKKPSSTKKKLPTPPTLIPMEDLSDMPSNTRVRLVGTVGTIPGLLSSKQFVIQTEDGRGLLISGNNQQLSPPYGSLVEITGTLRIQDKGITLSMLTPDRWRLLKKEGETHTRSVELLAPSLEDQWSLVSATGTVKDVSKTSFILETDGLELGIVVKPIIQYRAERLKKGDVVSVKGLLDHRSEQVKIVPRSASEITLLQHPALTQSQLPLAGTSSTLPPWMPIGAAGMTIAGVQGFKKIRKVQEEKRLKAVLEVAGSRWSQAEKEREFTE